MIRPLSYFAPVDDGRYLILDKDQARTPRARSPAGRRATPTGWRPSTPVWTAVVDLLRSLLLKTPVNAERRRRAT